MADNDNRKKTNGKFKKFLENYFIKIDKILEKIANFFKKDEFARYLLKLTAIFIIASFILSMFYLLMKPGVDTYRERLDKSYIKEIFQSQNINTNDIIIKKLTSHNQDTSQAVVYSVFDTKGKVGYASKVKTHGYIPDTPYNRDNPPLKEKMTIMVGIFTDTSLAGLRVISHQETVGLTAPLDDSRYLNHFSSDGLKAKTRQKVILKADIPQGIAGFKDVFGVDAISGASQTSMGLVNAIRQAYDSVRENASLD
jgi:Na+-translocating ferredoxin:NAD+ oxidoreductase RnfG subunit